MTKKEYLLKVLEKIQDVSPFARGLKLLIEKGNLSDEVVNTIQTLVDQKIQEERNTAEHAALKKTSEILWKLTSKEHDVKASEVAEMDTVLQKI